MNSKEITLKCGLTAKVWKDSWNSSKQWIKVDIVDFYEGTLSFQKMAMLLTELMEMGYDNVGIRIEDNYGDIEAMYLEGIKNNIKEHILCAAIWFDDGKPYVHQPTNIKSGFVICGHRHHNCFTTLSLCANDKKAFNYEKEQGFLTNTNKFVTREEAAKIAFDAGQTNELLTKLFSENLY